VPFSVFPRSTPGRGHTLWIVVWYVIAKLLEQVDYPIYHSLAISGHSLKRLAAAVSTGYFVRLFRLQYRLAAA